MSNPCTYALRTTGRPFIPLRRLHAPGTLLTTLTIVAVLVAAVAPWVMSYVSAARLRADQQTLTVLNDALTPAPSAGRTLPSAIGNNSTSPVSSTRADSRFPERPMHS